MISNSIIIIAKIKGTVVNCLPADHLNLSFTKNVEKFVLLSNSPRNKNQGSVLICCQEKLSMKSPLNSFRRAGTLVRIF